jgi:catechol 2,3-dioxygenase-like lactoylglutathione lyase family enzyme
MAVLEHYNIRTLDLAATIRFYEDIIGLKSGPYPGEPGRGAWIYDERDIPVVHVMSLESGNDEMALKFTRDRFDKLSPGQAMETSGSGALDHVAFRCEDYDGFVARLEAQGLPYHAVSFPDFHLRQIFVNDPSGVTCELNFLKQDFAEGEMGRV